MKLLTNMQAKRLDKIASEKHSRTGHSLMENAGRCISNVARSLLKKVQNPKILVMDEPTSVLSPQEVKNLFITLNALVKDETTILYITHKLEEVITICNSVTIMRDGEVIETSSLLARLEAPNNAPASAVRRPIPLVGVPTSLEACQRGQQVAQSAQAVATTVSAIL